jgi:hypothetical protein
MTRRTIGRFAHLRLHSEWFRPDQELIDFIESALTST